MKNSSMLEKKKRTEESILRDCNPQDKDPDTLQTAVYQCSAIVGLRSDICSIN